MDLHERDESGQPASEPLGSPADGERDHEGLTLASVEENQGRGSALDKAGPRNIALFSDGTGNSSGKLQKTNVWRLYEALDLGYPAIVRDGAENTALQLAYYDDGVGTSSFKPLYFLGGIFGFGLASNIRDLYMYLCRNYREGDQIFAFGFSRGAYTIRLVVALIASMGVIRYQSEAQLRRQTLDLWREYRRGFHTSYRLTDLLVAMGRAFVRLIVRTNRVLTGQPQYAAGLPGRRRPWWGREWFDYWWREKSDPEPAGPEIEFVGVWDTVAAYGGPFVEITRAIDAWIWPLTMPNYRLSRKVKRARHALAIDDKRDAFHPLLWDEVHEETLPGWNRENPRLQQVWFAGMHADVGGGYPDDFLSYVSLAWMIEHTEKAGLRVLDRHREHIFEVRNVFGPIHNSRGGMGAFYRYQPRYINAWLDYDLPVFDDSHVRPATQIYRDPTIDRGRYRNHGFIKSPIRLHHSVEERLLTATDGYAPNNLPSDYIVDDGVRGTLGSMANNASPVEDIYELGDRIKLRRMWYFLSVLMALIIVTKPLWDPWRLGIASDGVDVRTDTQLLATALNAVMPDMLSRWITSFANDPYLSIALFVTLGLTTARGLNQENAMVDISRRLWRHRFAAPIKGGTERGAKVAAGGPLRWAARTWRGSRGWQNFLSWSKWKGVPVLLGLLLWLMLLYFALAAITQLALVWQEVRPGQCPGAKRDRSDARVVDAEGIARKVDIRHPCIDLGVAVAPQQRYQVTVAMPGTGWTDDGIAASPEGWHDEAGSIAVISGGSKFFRRVATAPLFAPIFETRILKRTSGGFWYGDGIYMMRPALVPTGERCKPASRVAEKAAPKGENCIWQGIIQTGTFFAKPAEQRRLFFFLNDAVLPVDSVNCKGITKGCKSGWALFPIAGRYGNNEGEAIVTVRLLGPAIAR